MPDYDNKIPAYFGTVVSDLRKDAGLKQSDVAQRLTVDASRISRIESGDVSLTSSEAEALLKAIGTKNAEELQRFLSQEWQVLERPYFHHPERDTLYAAELTLQKLASFYQQEELPTPLYGEAKMHEESLLEVAKYLASLRHAVAYIGDIGVGKTTAVCIQTGLSVSKSDRASLPITALEIGAGGTTVCEVRIRRGLQYSLLVEPVTDAEIYKLAGELCAGIYDSNDITQDVSLSEKESQPKGVSREIDRALRNMTGLIRRRQKLPDGKTRALDPLKELAESSESLDDLCSEFNQRLSLWKRSRREISYDEINEMSELEWLQKAFMDINNGRHEEFSLPKRIDITVPFNPLSTPSYEIEVIDTKGVDQTAVRPDLQACIDDPRTIIVLCSRFNDAPGTSAQSLIEHLNKTGQSTILGERISILVLPRPAEAVAMKDDSGEQAQEDEDGYGMKFEQVEMLLKRIGAENIPMHFFNAVSDDAQSLNQFMVDRLLKLRAEKISRVSAICSAVDYLIKNQEQEYVRVSQNEVSKRLRIFLTQYSELPNHNWKIEQHLINEIKNTHARTVWASLRREGSWSNLDVHFTLGYGARVEARKCTEKMFYGLREIVQNMLGDKDLEPSHIFLNELDSNWFSWYNSFLNRVQKIGSQIFRNSLDNHPVWIECAELYGQQKQFRNEVTSKLDTWFKGPQQQHLYNLLESRIGEMWKTEVLGQLSKFVDEE